MFQSKKWVVVMVNECRASIVPLGHRSADDASVVFDEEESTSTGISPNSECDVVGYVKGSVKKRKVIELTHWTPTPKDLSLIKRKRPQLELPDVPEESGCLDIVAEVLSHVSPLLLL